MKRKLIILTIIVLVICLSFFSYWCYNRSSNENVNDAKIKKFVGSIASNKYHYPTCYWATRISPENQIWFSSSQDAQNHGYVACSVCHPP